MIRKFVAVLLSVTMIFSFASAGFATESGEEASTAAEAADMQEDEVSAMADSYSGTCGDSLTWTLDADTGVLTISGTGAMKDYSLYGPWYQYRKEIETVVINEGVTKIGKHAFYECSYLKEITLPASVTTIGQEAFEFCDSLEKISVPEDNSYFYAADGVLFDKNGVLIKYPGANGRTSYSVPEGTTAIGASAFAWCDDLTEITFPDTVTSVGDDAFHGCTELTVADLGNGLVEIGDFGFYLCFALETLTLPDSLTRIGNWAFEGASVTEVTIGSGMESIGYGLFSNCTDLTWISVSADNENFKSVDGVLFSSDGTVLVQYPCGKTDAAYAVPDGVTHINGGAFDQCRTITSVTFPDSLETIGFMAFSGCSNLSGSITFPERFSGMDQFVFGNTDVTEFYFKGNMPEVDYSFSDVEAAVVYYPEGDSTWDLDAEINDWGTLAYERFAGDLAFETWDTPVVTTSDISRCTVTLSIVTYIYNGYARKPSVTVSDGSYTLVSGTDYTYTYSNNTNAGTATVRIEGIGNYRGSVEKTFTIAKASQEVTASISASTIQKGSTASVTASGIGSITYSSDNTSVATVSSSGTVTGVGAGTAVITVNAAGNSNYKSASRTISVTVKENVSVDVSLDTLTYAFSNSWSSFGYSSSYKIPLSSFQVIFSSQRARTLYQVQSVWSGSCYGMSATSCMFNVSGDDLIISDFSTSADSVSDLKVSNTSSTLNMNLTGLIEAVHVSQHASEVQERMQYKRSENTSLAENLTVLTEICEAVQAVDNGGAPVVLGMLRDKSGHAIVAYKYEKISSTSEKLYVYDCNYPSTDRYITLTKNSSGRYTSWYYTSKYCSANSYDMTYVPYDVYEGVWENRSSKTSAASNSLNSTESILTVSTDSFEILNLQGDVVGTAEDGVFTAVDDGIYEIELLDAETECLTIYLPTDTYRIVDKSNSADEMEITMVNVDQSVSVTTQADEVEILTEDSQAACLVNINGLNGELYEVEINSDLEYAEEKESVSYSGWCRDEEITVGTAYGELVADNYENSGVYINDAALNFQYDDDIDISSYQIGFSEAAYAYTGDPIEPAVVIEKGGMETALVENTDYMVVYSDNTEIGEAQATVYGINQYKGKVSLSFTIEEGEQDENTAGMDAILLRRGSTFYLINSEDGSTEQTFTCGESTDEVLNGDWDGDGYDTLCLRSGNTYYFSNTLGGDTEYSYSFGKSTDEVLVGDWDGDGIDTLCLRRGSTFYICNSPDSGTVEYSFTFGGDNDEVFVGDWDGDGYDTLSIHSGNVFYICNTLGGEADYSFSFGKTTDTVIVGDWDGDGADGLCLRRGTACYISNDPQSGTIDTSFSCGRAGDEVYAGTWGEVAEQDNIIPDTLGLRRGNTFHISYSLEGTTDLTFTCGKDTDEILVGDWDGDGLDTICLRRGNRYYFSNTLGGEIEFYIDFGKSSDEVFAGDWDGDGVDTLCIRRDNHYYINNTLEGGNAETDFSFGKTTDEVLAGDWDGDGCDTLCIRRGNVYYMNNTLAGGYAEVEFSFGRSTDPVIVGDWDGDGCDTLCIRRGSTYFIDNSLTGGNAETSFDFGKETDEVFAGKWTF